MTARASALKIKRHMIERGNPLSAVTQVTSQELPKHVSSHGSINFNVEDETNHDRTGNPLSTDLGVKPQTNGFHEFILFCCR